MSNYTAGHNAETRAAKHLETQGFRIRELNWKNRFAEIDIVAEKDQVIYFVEVKYRRNTKHGSGYEYVTPKKLKRMYFAAEMWVQNRKWTGDYQLAVVSIDAERVSFFDASSA